jgi:hypothetical protein
MEHTYTANCNCGFNQYIEVGHSLESPEKNYFPFYCKKCGLVPVNIASEYKECPTCTSKEVAEYGVPTLSTEVTKNTDFFDPRRPEKFIESYDLHEKHFQVSTGGNFCPKCNNMSMEFLYSFSKNYLG